MNIRKVHFRFSLTLIAGVLLILASIMIQNTSASGQGKIQIKTAGNVEFVYIAGGSFTMGGKDNTPHEVTVSSFWIGKYEVTQKQYQGVIGKNPSSFKGDSLPVEMISWNDAKDFCASFTLKYGELVRLPTEAEWEYACKAGSTTKYYWGDSMDGNYCWYGENSDEKSHPAGQKLPNAWGLYDMSGNVWEWCGDWSNSYYFVTQSINPKGPSYGSWRVFRGGCWGSSSEYWARSAVRNGYYPDIRRYDIGFRLVMEEK